MLKSPSVAFCTKMLQTRKKQVLYDFLDEVPLKVKDYAFMADIIEGLNNDQLAAKYKKSPSRISQWKRRCFEDMHRFFLAQDQTTKHDDAMSNVDKQLSSIDEALSRLDKRLSNIDK